MELRAKKVIVLKKNMNEDKALQIIDSKKTGMFKTVLNRPKKKDVHIHSIKTCYECRLVVSGKYIADYYRKATHTVTVDHNVKEIILGDGVFPARIKSGINKALTFGHGKNKIDLQLEEHVFVNEEGRIVFDQHGKVIKFPSKIDPKNTENYPKRLLSKNNVNVRKSEITYDTAISKLQDFLKKHIESEVRGLREEFVIQDVMEIYVPIFEARLVGPKKVKIIRIDAIKNKIL